MAPVSGYSAVKVPPVDMLTSICGFCSVNQSGIIVPGRFRAGCEPCGVNLYSFSGLPLTGRRPMLLVPGSVNQSAPSGPLVMASGCAFPVRWNCVKHYVRLGRLSCSMRQIEFVPGSVHHMFPSEPSVDRIGRAAGSGRVYSTYGGPVDRNLARRVRGCVSVNQTLSAGPGPDAMPMGPALLRRRDVFGRSCRCSPSVPILLAPIR